MALQVFVFVFLLVVCLFLSLALLWLLDWFHRRSSSSRGGAKRTTVQRLLKPRSPGDCPACRLSCTNSCVVGLAPVPVRPWCEVKSRRGAPKRVNTEGFACPNPKCPYFGITDAQIHALVGDGKHGQAEHIQTFRCQACRTTFSARRHTPLYRLKTPSHQIAVVLSALAEGLDASAAERVFGYRQATITTWLSALGNTLKPFTSAASAVSTSRISSWTNSEPGCAAPTRSSGSGWPSIPSPRFFLRLSSAPAPKPWPISSSTRCDRSWPLAASPFSSAMA